MLDSAAVHALKTVALTALFASGMWTSNASAQVRTLVIHSFTGPDGADPSSGLIETPDGSFLGVTYAGGESDLGTIYRMMPNGTVTVLHSFAGGSDGAHPGGTLLTAGDAYYGTAGGGIPNRGIIFKLTADGQVTTLHEFQGGPGDGSGPSSLQLLASDGNFYGTSIGGGEHGEGTIFRMSPAGDVEIVYSFPGGFDGEWPGDLIQTSDGNFYGSASGGYSSPLVSGLGILFRMTLDSQVTILHRFTDVDGNGPGGLVQGLDGNLYGTTVAGGQSRLGTVFRLTLSGTLTTIHSFTGAPNGAYPLGLTRGTDGALYGTTSAGGRAFTFSSTGMAFRITTSGAFSSLHVFQGTFDAYEPRSGLLQASDGNLYGTAVAGSFSGDIFRIDTLLCEDSVDAITIPDGLHLGFTLHSWAPGTWNVWAVTQAGVFRLWSKEVPRLVPPALHVGIGFQFPRLGPVGILTTLTTPTLNSMCLDWKVVDTGSPSTTSSSR